MQRSFLVLWALVAIVGCWRLDVPTRPLAGDARHYFFMAERATAGIPPHVSHVDTKNQLGVLVTSVFLDAGRLAGLDDVVASRVANIAFAAAAVVLAAQLGALLSGTALAGSLAALAMIAARGFLDHAANGNSVKVILAAFALLAHVAIALGGRRARASGEPSEESSGGSSRGSSKEAWAWQDALAGASGAAAFLCWQPALLVPAAVSVEARFGGGGSWRRAGVVVGAGALVVLAYEAYFLAHGALADQLEQAYVMTLGSVHEPRRIWGSVLFVASEATRSAWPLRTGPLAFAALGTGLLLRALRWPSCLRDVRDWRPGTMAFALAGSGAAAFTVYDHQGVPDLFFPDPYFAVSAGLVFAWCAARRAWAGAAAGLLMAAMLVVQIVWDEQRREVRRFTIDDQRLAASEVARLHREAGSVWVYEAVHLLGLARLDNHVPYGLLYDDVASVLDLDTYRPLKDGRWPEVIVHGRKRPPGARRYLEADYEEMPSRLLGSQSLHVWRRRGGQGR